jgi:hypothetical protein
MLSSLSIAENEQKNLYVRYPNIKRVISKVPEAGETDFVSVLLQAITNLLPSTDEAITAPETQSESDTKEFDVFISYNSKELNVVKTICNQLKQQGLKPWIDDEQILAGRLFKKAIKGTIPKVKTAAIFIGIQGLGQWQEVELRSFISLCVKKNIPVIPILLPGIEGIPDELLLLQEFSYVAFKSLDDTEAFNKLVRGIKGEQL